MLGVNWLRGKGVKNMNDLLAAIKSRSSKLTEFHYGIVTADCYAKDIFSCSGHDLCNKYFSKGNVSWNDIVTKASKTLTYSNDEMQLDGDVKGWDDYPELSGIEKPKNVLTVFKHTITSQRKDRDGDVLYPKGASIDPNMNLLFGHVHTLPIGKMLKIADRNEQRIKLYSCIIDTNELSHDCAVWVENKMGRYSHGFKATEFNEIKDGSGFEVKTWEMMEESLVMVPSNVDATTDEVLFSLVSGGKLTSPLMKSFGDGIREKRREKSISVSVPDLSHIIKAVVHELKPTETKAGCGCQAGAGASKEADGTSKVPGEGKEGTQHKEVKTYSQVVKSALKDEYDAISDVRSEKYKKFWPVSDVWYTFCDVYFDGKNTADDLPRLIGYLCEELTSYSVSGKAVDVESLATKFTKLFNTPKAPKMTKSAETEGVAKEEDCRKTCEECGCEMEDGICPKCKKSITPDEAAVTFMSKSSAAQRQNMLNFLLAQKEIDERTKRTNSYSKIFKK